MTTDSQSQFGEQPDINKEKRSGPAPERIILRPVANEKLESLLAQLNSEFKGMIRISKSDIANYLIGKHGLSFEPFEIEEIKGEHYDEVRWLTWALAKIRVAKRQGISLSLEDLKVSRKVPTGSKQNMDKKSRRKLKVNEQNQTQSNPEPA